jgi:CrcB protein
MGYVLSSRDRRSERHQIALTVGFCGALTTFSGFVLDTAIVLDEQRWALALSYVTGTVLVSILAVVAGRHAGRVRGSNLDRRLS